jgi:hypothetical protein
VGRLERFLKIVLLAALLLFTRPARAELPPLSDYERGVIDEILKQRHSELDSEPDGKRIEGIDLVMLEVFDESDPIPDGLNVFHTTTKKSVIERELLFQEGAPYDQRVIDESARNLRHIHQLSVVLIVPVRGKSRDVVRVLVITKDVWSLRLNSDFELENRQLNYLLLNPSEENLAGTHTSVGGLYIRDPVAHSFGLILRQRRIAGSKVRGLGSANLIVNHQSGAPEGSFGALFVGQPLVSADTEWAWSTSGIWQHEVTRRFTLGKIAQFAAATGENLPIVYNSDEAFAAVELTRSFGVSDKYDLSWGVEVFRRLYSPLLLTGFSQPARDEFARKEIPVSDTRISPYLELRAYSSRFSRAHYTNTLALEENYRLGPELIARIYPASADLGSSRDLVGTFSAASFTAEVGDGIARAVASSTIEVASRSRHDALLEVSARWVTPSLPVGRLVYDAKLQNRYRNYLNRKSLLGGNNRLRGYLANQFEGKDLVIQNLEFRTRSVNVLSAQLGMAAFYDVGDAFDGFNELELHHGAGLGLRILFPQAERIVLRADWGMPIQDPQFRPCLFRVARGCALPGTLFVTFGQAFDMPQLSSPSIPARFESRTE